MKKEKQVSITVTIDRIENGFILFEDHPEFCDGRKWVFENEDRLGEFIKEWGRLCQL